MGELIEKKFTLNRQTSNQLLQHHALVGNSENIKQFLKQIQTDERDQIIFDVIYDLALSNQTQYIDKLMAHLNPADLNEPMFEKTITRFVENDLSDIIPTLLPVINVKINGVEMLFKEMLRVDVSAEQFRQTIANLKAKGIAMDKEFDRYGFKQSSFD